MENDIDIGNCRWKLKLYLILMLFAMIIWVVVGIC